MEDREHGDGLSAARGTGCIGSTPEGFSGLPFPLGLYGLKCTTPLRFDLSRFCRSSRRAPRAPWPMARTE